jgi:hypothetical protein
MPVRAGAVGGRETATVHNGEEPFASGEVMHLFSPQECIEKEYCFQTRPKNS